MRLFFAFFLSVDTIRSLNAWRDPLILKHPYLNWAPLDQLHVTLRFLGKRDPEQVVSEVKLLDLDKMLPVEYILNHSGRFGKPPNVIWLSGRFSSEVNNIAKRLSLISDNDGNFGTDRSFKPHVTVARAPRGVDCPIPSFNEQISGSSNSIQLINSRLTVDGPVYSTLFSVSS